ESAQEVIAALAPMAGILADDLRRRLAAPNSDGHGDVAPHHPLAERPAPPACETGARNNPDYQNLWKALGDDPTAMDQLVARTALTPAKLSSMLLLMELDGRVATQHGRYYRKR
ncbi:MAG TPA: hypothetical protein VK827_09255, partial [Lysobacter sp.]|nr:hypothetical protein [Lysobacter sp.]